MSNSNMVFGGRGKGRFSPVPVRPASAFGNTSKAISIEGFDTIIKNLNKEILRISHGSRDGLVQVAKFIRRKMDEEQPYIPMETGALRGSWQTHPIHQNKKYGLMMGFSAGYALWVHEAPTTLNWTIPGSGPKYL